MEWTDEGIVVGVRRHGEAGAIIDVLTVEHGSATSRCGAERARECGRSCSPAIGAGDWRARLDEHLGNYAVEGLRLRAGRLS